MRIGVLCSGGDAPGMNPCLRSIVRTACICDIEVYGIRRGYEGLLNEEFYPGENGTPIMGMRSVSGLSKVGGTILRSSRSQRFQEPAGVKHAEKILRKYGFDGLITIGGNGTQNGAIDLGSVWDGQIIGIPGTIDNDLYGTDYSFGFDSAVAKATDVLDTLHSTAAAHGRIFVCELMGRKAGWVALYAGIAGGADVILLPEIPYTFESVLEVIEKRNQIGKNFSIIAIAEGAVTKDSAGQSKKKERKVSDISPGMELVRRIDENLKQDVRLVIPGHFQRGGDPTPADRVFCSRLGAMAGELVLKRKFGCMVALQGNSIGAIPLSEVAGKLRMIPQDNEVLKQASLLGISLGE